MDLETNTATWLLQAIDPATGTLFVGNNNSSGSFAGVIQNTRGSLALELVGNGTLYLTNTSNSYAGGTTIIQVTHSDLNASYGSRIINLRDGWIVDD